MKKCATDVPANQKRGKFVKTENMKNKLINIRTSEEDRAALNRAAVKLSEQTGKKANVSKTILAAVKVVADLKPELFFCNRQAIRDLDNNIEAGRKLLQSLVDELAKAAPGITVTIADISRWFGTGRNDFMVAKTIAIRDFVISALFEMQREKYPDLQFNRENIIAPDLSEVLEAAAKMISVPSVNWRETGIFWSAYEIAGGTVTVIPAKAEEIKNQFRCYAETPEERQRLSKVRELCERMNAFIKGESFDPARLNIPDVCHYDHESGRFEPSELYVKFSLK